MALKQTTIMIRVTAQQKRAFRKAAKAAGMGLSTWLRWLAIRESEATIKRE